MKKMDARKSVKDAYGRIAQGDKGCGCGSCCGGQDTKEFARSIGYSEGELKTAPDGANLALGCGNPTALAGLRRGETVLDLGSGAGFDCFLAAARVGPQGRVIGVDMTPEMVRKARENAAQNQAQNIEFRLGEIEHLPVEDNSIDVVISNCVINLSSDKPRVFAEIHRVLKPGGRVAISDMALLKELPPEVRASIDAYVGCVGGAVLKHEYERMVRASGLTAVKVADKGYSGCIAGDTKDPIGRAMLDGLPEGAPLQDYVTSILVEARKRS